MRGIGVLVAGAALLAACSKPKAVAEASKADPNKPAVIQVPPVILPSDTAKPDTMIAYRERMASALSELLPEYSIVAAAAVRGDVRMLQSEFAPEMTLHMADTTISGREAAANGLAFFARRNSIREILRQSRVLNAIGPTYTDSGAYLMISQRGVGKPVEQRGTYVSVWRRGTGSPPQWQMVRDELTADRPAAKKR